VVEVYQRSEVLSASIIVALMMEAASTFETSVNVYQITGRNKPTSYSPP
jgi:hypothetical protein